MQSVSSAWTAEERDVVRKIVQNSQISWKKQTTLGNRTFTIGVSSIGGSDIIGINPGAVGSPGNYRYFDESAYVTGLSWERGLNMPIGGLSKALAEIKLDNTSGRFTPRYMGGNSELFTAQPLRSPVVINAGFNFAGIDQVIPQFAGIISEQPEIDMRDRSMRIRAADYIDYFQGKYLDQETMFTSQRTDTVMEELLSGTLGMSTAQYVLDPGINVIPFGIFRKGTKMADIFHELAESENGHFYQDESGIFRFENRQHWDSSPFTQVQRVILTGQVIQAESPNTDHLINVVEVRSKVVEKQPEQIIFRLNPFDSFRVPGNSSAQFFIEFESPALSATAPTNNGTTSYFNAFTNSDGTGTELSDLVTVSSFYKFAHSAKIEFTNNSPSDAFITNLVISGRTAKPVGDLYTRLKDDSSVTAYQERVHSIDNPYIQNVDWANSLAQVILNDFSDIEKLQRIVIRAIPELQLGDLVSWQGRYWRVFDIKTTLDPSAGFIQELTLLQRVINQYFRIGISTIGGTDKIAP